MPNENLKKFLLFAAPAVIATVLGYYYFKRRNAYGSSLSDAIKAANDSTTSQAAAASTGLEAALLLKERGNKNFRVRRYAKAVEDYTAALEQCPPGAEAEATRATLHQNRAAARESIADYAAALEDCTAALQLHSDGVYIKALTRRARLHEKLGNLKEALEDITAVCLIEKFSNPENVACMDRMLKQLGEKMAKEETTETSKGLPSPDFIKSYLSSSYHNPFTVEAMTIGRKPTKKSDEATKEEKATPAADAAAAASNDGDGGVSSDIDSIVDGEGKEDPEAAKETAAQPQENGEPEAKLPAKILAAYKALMESFEKLAQGDFEWSYKLVSEAVKDFTLAGSVDGYTFERSELGALEKPQAAWARAQLLQATYKGLCGLCKEAKTEFLSVGESLFAPYNVRVAALTRAATLFIAIDKDVSGCMYAFQQAQTLQPDNADVYLARGQMHILQEQYDSAEADLKEAVRLAPGFSVAAVQRDYLLYRKALTGSGGASEKDIEACIQKIAALTTKFPTCVECKSIYAQVLAERGNFDAADAAFDQLARLTPTSGLPYVHRGVIALRRGQMQATDASVTAEAWFARAVDIDPRCELAWELRGQLALERGELDAAEAHFTSALENSRSNADRVHLLALREGVRAQKHALATYPGSIPPLAQLIAEMKAEMQQRMASAAAAAGGIPGF